MRRSNLSIHLPRVFAVSNFLNRNKKLPSDWSASQGHEIAQRMRRLVLGIVTSVFGAQLGFQDHLILFIVWNKHVLGVELCKAVSKTGCEEADTLTEQIMLPGLRKICGFVLFFCLFVCFCFFVFLIS